MYNNYCKDCKWIEEDPLDSDQGLCHYLPEGEFIEDVNVHYCSKFERFDNDTI